MPRVDSEKDREYAERIEDELRRRGLDEVEFDY